VEVGRYVVMLDGEGSAVYPHHVDERKHYDYGRPIGRLTAAHDGLANLSEISWSVRTPGHSTMEVKAGDAVPLVSGTTIHFGTSSGVLRC
jgi:hypothetical protein